MLGAQLATIHNLHHYLTLMRELREAIESRLLDRYVAEFYARRGVHGQPIPTQRC